MHHSLARLLLAAGLLCIVGSGIADLTLHWIQGQWADTLVHVLQFGVVLILLAVLDYQLGSDQ